jgi:glyoxylase-like metal-dependent hydrolase (beta-lactamase superfamily II)
MPLRVIPIPMSALAGVNAYLLEQDGAFVLIDTGLGGGRKTLLAALHEAGCEPGDLRLVVITHADPDHIGSAAFLREHYKVPVAMHPKEADVVENGGFFTNRVNRPNAFVTGLLKVLGFFFRAQHFSPDVLLTEGSDLSEYGVDATVLELPGHSLGSIGVLTAEGDLFCGDLMENRREPRPGSIVDDRPTRDASIERARGLGVRTAYPGHGKPFAMGDLELSRA